MKLEEMNPFETGWLQESVFHAAPVIPSFRRGGLQKVCSLLSWPLPIGGRTSQSAGIDHSDSCLSEVLSLSRAAAVLRGM